MIVTRTSHFVGRSVHRATQLPAELPARLIGLHHRAEHTYHGRKMTAAGRRPGYEKRPSQLIDHEKREVSDARPDTLVELCTIHYIFLNLHLPRAEEGDFKFAPSHGLAWLLSGNWHYRKLHGSVHGSVHGSFYLGCLLNTTTRRGRGSFFGLPAGLSFFSAN